MKTRIIIALVMTCVALGVAGCATIGTIQNPPPAVRMVEE
jgi:hypothetical protein